MCKHIIYPVISNSNNMSSADINSAERFLDEQSREGWEFCGFWPVTIPLVGADEGKIWIFPIFRSGAAETTK